LEGGGAFLQDFFQILLNTKGEEIRENEEKEKKQTLIQLVINYQAIVRIFW
jgi:hypothetical protein